MQNPLPEVPTIATLGCRLNAQESETVRSHAIAAGLGDVLFVNTCAVTGEAVSQARQTIRRARRERPNRRIVVTGCAAQIDPGQFSAMPEVDHVIGNAEKLTPQTYAALGRSDAPRLVVGDIMSVRQARQGDVHALPSRARAFLPIQNGCDHRCTFCVIPLGRGPSRSENPGTIVAAARRLVDEGVREIVLTGVDITSWGGDLAGPRLFLGNLVARLLEDVPGLSRLRLSSLDQAETDDRLLDLFGSEPRLMPHVHLSLQHGSDLILKRMKRRHSRADAIEFCRRLRRARPDVAIGADLIAGFPTETEAHFADTLSLIEACGIDQVHAFPFSARPGTPAARMPQLAPQVVHGRARQLSDAARRTQKRWFDGFCGRLIDAHLEGSGPRNGRARTCHFAPIVLSGLPSGHAPGDTVRARVTGHDGQRLLAEAVA